MRNIIFATITLAISGCSSTESQQLAPNDSRICAQNFTHQGSLVTGKIFRTHQIIPGASKSSVYSKLAEHIALDGWHIINSDKDLGILSASQTVAFGKGKTAPLNISVNQQNNQAKVSISFATSMGVHSPAEAVMNSFCEMIEAAE